MAIIINNTGVVLLLCDFCFIFLQIYFYVPSMMGIISWCSTMDKLYRKYQFHYFQASFGKK